MSRHPFAPEYDDLPKILPVFPLEGAMLLPGERLPLNIFEPRYLAMVLDSLAGSRMIGMIQPCRPDPGIRRSAAAPDLYMTGCAGRISSFSETEDGRLLITLSGMIRFAIREELAERQGYRAVAPDYAPWADDMAREVGEPVLKDRDSLVAALRGYFDLMNMQANWDGLAEIPDARLVNSLSMLCPFSVSEKQGLLECKTLHEREELMKALIEMAIKSGQAINSGPGGESPLRN